VIVFKATKLHFRTTIASLDEITQCNWRWHD